MAEKHDASAASANRPPSFEDTFLMAVLWIGCVLPYWIGIFTGYWPAHPLADASWRNPDPYIHSCLFAWPAQWVALKLLKRKRLQRIGCDPLRHFENARRIGKLESLAQGGRQNVAAGKD